MFGSALLSTLGEANPLQFRATRSACVLLVDGLGSHNLRSAGGHARYLNAALAASKSIHCGFPSTTATSISSFGTGLAASKHGIFGYKVVDPKSQRGVSMLSDWDQHLKPEDWQVNETIAQQALGRGIEPWFVGPAEYEESGFTKLTMRGAKYRAAKTIQDRFAAALQLLQEPSKKLVYLYVPELDQLAHRFGVESDRWLGELEELEAAVASLVANLPKNCGFALTADHGVLDVPATQQIYLDEMKLARGIRIAAGDPRSIFAYLQPEVSVEEWVAAASTELGERCWVASTADWVQAGWYGGPIDIALLDRLPEAIIVAREKVALYDRRSAPVKSLNMIGQHGGVSDVEMQVPLLRWQI